MNVSEFRKELLKIMPGYKWTIKQSSNEERMTAIGTKSSGFNRISTLQVIKTVNNGAAFYLVMSAPSGTRFPWASEAGNRTLAKALRDLQNIYQRKAAKYQSLAQRLEDGRAPRCERTGKP